MKVLYHNKVMHAITVILLSISVLWMTATSTEESVNVPTTEESVNRLRKSLNEQRGAVGRRQLWIPSEDTGIVLHTACQRHGKGCPDAYVKWLQGVVDATLSDDPDPNDGAQAVTNRHALLLSERIREKERHIVELQRDLALKMSNECAPMIRVLQTPLIHDSSIESVLELVHSSFVWISMTLLPPLFLHALPCVTFAALLTWIFVDINLIPKVLRYIENSQAPAQDRRCLADSLLAFRWVGCLHRLRLVMTVTMVALVVLSVWTLSGSLFRDGNLMWFATWLIPREYLELGTIIAVLSFTLATIGVMVHDVNCSLSDLLRVEQRAAEVHDGALQAAAAAHRQLVHRGRLTNVIKQ